MFYRLRHWSVVPMVFVVIGLGCSEPNNGSDGEPSSQSETSTQEDTNSAASSDSQDSESQDSLSSSDSQDSGSSSGSGSETGETQSGEDSATEVIDGDSDGWVSPFDCNDSDSTVWPGAEEIVGNNVDDDCDGATDESENGTDTEVGTGDTEDATDTLDTGTQDTVVTCDGDLDCPVEQFCHGGECVDDVCSPSEFMCDQGGAVIGCAANGSGEQTVFTCGSEAYFESVCLEDGGQAACTCEDDWDCPANTVCDVDFCVGTGVEPTCSLPPEPFANVLPSIEIQWGGDSMAQKKALGSPFPDSAQTVMTPVVANLDDDNGDGLINEKDFPEILFLTFCNSEYTTNGVLRAIHGGGPGKGGDYFATCGDTVWHEGDPTNVACACSAADLNATASIAVGDLDADGKPEIVAMREGTNAGLTIYDNTGEIISRSADLNMGYVHNPGVTLANLDNSGFAEIVVGRHVYTLEKAADTGALQILDHFTGNKDHGTNTQGPVSCVANVAGDDRPEIIAGTSVYRLPRPPSGVTKRADCVAGLTDPEEVAFCGGNLILVWNAKDLDATVEKEGFCAVADILGADEAAAPGPVNPLNGTAEVITISNGYLQIFNGETGALLRKINPNLGTLGGAPNVDDFDGDGFPEVGSAFSAAYIMFDLQAATTQCPEWPNVFLDSSTDPLQGNPARADDCLHNGWKRTTEDNSSKVTGSSVFDFNGDGAAEVVYNDECYFRIYDGKNGQVLFKEHSPSRTRIEYPIVADVDNDGNAEIVFGASNESGFCSEGNDYNNGLEVWGDASDTWVSARRVWNQHAYHVTNVTEGGSIPAHEPESWLPYGERVYNTYRSNPRSYGVAPDLVITDMQVSSPNAKCGSLTDVIEIAVRLENQGDLRIGPGVVIGFYGIWGIDPAEALMGPGGVTPLTIVLQSSLEPGDQIMATVTYEASYSLTHAQLPERIRVVADDGDKERECNEGNNSYEDVVEPGELLPDLVLEIDAVDQSTCPSPKVTMTVRNEGSALAQNVIVGIYAGDPQQGGSKIGEVSIGDLAVGQEETVVVNLNGFPPNISVKIYGVVDPANTVKECNDGNNSASAEQKIICISVD